MGAWARAPLELTGVKHAIVAEKEFHNGEASTFPVSSAVASTAASAARGGGGGGGGGGGTVAVVIRDLPAKVSVGQIHQDMTAV